MEAACDLRVASACDSLRLDDTNSSAGGDANKKRGRFVSNFGTHAATSARRAGPG
jgi:hypothetical protein